MKKAWFACVCILTLSGIAAASELYVGTGDGLPSLTEAVLAANAGDTIHVSSGVYTDATETYPITIDKPLTIYGEEGAVLEGAPFMTLLKVSAPDVTISGIGLRFLRTGIYCTGDRLTVSSCSFVMYDDAYRVSSCAVWLGGVYGCTMDACEFWGCSVGIGGPPVSATSKGRPVLTGLFEVGEDRAFFTSHRLSGNTVNGKPLYYFANETKVVVPNDAGGVIAAGCDEVTVAGVDVSDGSMGLQLAYCDHVLLDNVTADRCGIFGAYLAYCHGGTLTGVRCTESNHGIDVRACSALCIASCSTVGCEQGVFLSFARNCIVDDCSIIRCGNGVFVAVGQANQFAGNCVRGNENGIYVQNETDMLVCGNAFDGNTVAGVRFLRSTGHVLENAFHENQTGMLAAESEALTVWRNTFASDISVGLYLRDTAAIRVSANLFDERGTLFIEMEGSMPDALIWKNTFRGGRDQVLDGSEEGVVLEHNFWSD